MRWVLGLVLAVCLTSPAQAAEGDPMPPMRAASTTVCVVPDFPEVGSGWRLHASVRNWNVAQSAVVFTFEHVEGCTVVRVHRYSADDGWGGYTTWDNWWPVTLVQGVYHYGAVDVYLNDYYPHRQPQISKWRIEHELGHAIGLPHSYTTRSVMSYTYNAFRRRGVIGVADTLAVYALYQ